MKNYIFASKEIENLATELKELLNDGGSYSGATIVAQTSVTLQPKKNGCPYGKKDAITKLCLYGCSVNGIYRNAINNQRKRENKTTDFVPKKNWFVPLFDFKNGSIIAKRKEVENGLPITEIYVKFVSDYAEIKGYFFNGRKATKSEIETIKKYKKNRKKEASKSQGIEDSVIICTVKASNIRIIKANKKEVVFK